MKICKIDGCDRLRYVMPSQTVYLCQEHWNDYSAASHRRTSSATKTAKSRRRKARDPEKYAKQMRLGQHRKQEKQVGLEDRYVDQPSDDCGICGDPMLGRAHDVNDRMSDSVGHFPSKSWLVKHPDFDGPCVRRPEHWGCNRDYGAGSPEVPDTK